jgi:hypothetical protein
MSITKANQIPNTQMEHSHPIIDPIVTQNKTMNTLIGHLMTPTFLTY